MKWSLAWIWSIFGAQGCLLLSGRPPPPLHHRRWSTNEDMAGQILWVNKLDIVVVWRRSTDKPIKLVFLMSISLFFPLLAKSQSISWKKTLAVHQILEETQEHLWLFGKPPQAVVVINFNFPADLQKRFFMNMKLERRPLSFFWAK